mgnify:CR=1 FL=1
MVCNKVLKYLVKTDFTYMIRKFYCCFVESVITALDFLIVFYSKIIPSKKAPKGGVLFLLPLLDQLDPSVEMV